MKTLRIFLLLFLVCFINAEAQKADSTYGYLVQRTLEGQEFVYDSITQKRYLKETKLLIDSLRQELKECEEKNLPNLKVIDENGVLDAGQVTITGTIYAQPGLIKGWKISKEPLNEKPLKIYWSNAQKLIKIVDEYFSISLGLREDGRVVWKILGDNWEADPSDAFKKELIRKNPYNNNPKGSINKFYEDTQNPIRKELRIWFLKEYDDYAKECYADSTQKNIHHPNAKNQMCSYDWDCIVESHWWKEWIHKETSFEGFIEYLKKMGN